MRTAILLALVLLAVRSHATAADAAADWPGVRVMPKLGAVVKVGNEIVDDETHHTLSLPWIVQDADDERLWVGDEHKGWVQRSQVVTLDEAPAYYTTLIKSNQQTSVAYNLRAVALDEMGDLDSAIADYGVSIRLKPVAVTYNSRGVAWLGKKNYDEAIADFDQTIRLDPNYVFAYINRGNAWAKKKGFNKAITDYNEAIRIDPNLALGYSNTAWLRATCTDERYRNGEKAVELATKACELTGWTLPKKLDTLAAAYAETGDFDSAIKYQNRAIELNPTDAEFVKGSNERLELYKDHKPYREE